jgi:hypothetical protein
MRVKLRNPDREVHVGGGRPVGTVLKELVEIYERAAP